MIDLPEDVPTGAVMITVQPIGNELSSDSHIRREQINAKLRSLDLLAENVLSEEEAELAEEMSEEEAEVLGRKLAGTRPVEDYINEDREERF